MSTAQIYSFENLEAWTSQQFARVAPTSKALTSRRSKTSNVSEFPAASFTAVKAGCSWVEESSANARMDEPTWYALASIVGNCEDGEEIFHEISALDDRYDEDETSAKLAHATKDAGPRLCENIHSSVGYEGCRRCPFYGKIASPISLGGQPADIVSLMRANVLDTETGRYLDLRTGVFASTRAFNDRFGHVTGDRLPHTRLSRDKLTRKVDLAAYRPGKDSLFVTLENGQESVNTWEPSSLQPVAGDCSKILEHFGLMFPDNTVREHFLDCLAFMVQNPGLKIGHAFVLIGKQGTGKSLPYNLVAKLFGQKNCCVIGSNSFGTRFNAHMTDVQLLVVEELWTAERRETYNSVKTLISERMMPVEEKNIPVYEARTPDFILATSNHAIPITIEDGDRRFCLYESPMEPQSTSYYDTLAASIEGDAGAFLDYLLNRDIAAFAPNRAPPITATKNHILLSSRNQVEQEIEAMIDENDPSFWRDVVNLNDVRAAVARRTGRFPTPNEARQALKAVGAILLGNVRIARGRSVRLWAWRNPSKWADASHDEIRQHLQELGPNSIGDGE